MDSRGREKDYLIYPRNFREFCKDCNKLRDGSHKTYCKDCSNRRQREKRQKNPEQHRAYANKWTAKNRDYVNQVSRTKRRLYKFGISHDQFLNKREQQNDICPICQSKMIEGTSKRGIALDHNHLTGQVRDLLCQSCNRGLGMFSENIDTLEAAIKYLKKWSDVK